MTRLDPTYFRTRNKKTEESLQIRVATYIKKTYPGVIFLSDAQGLYMTIPQAVKWKRMNSEHRRTDITILARSSNGEWSGMCLELKPEGTTIYKKIGPEKGDMVADPHIRAQAECHELLRAQGYWADFCCGYEDSVKCIDDYMGAVNVELF